MASTDDRPAFTLAAAAALLAGLGVALGAFGAHGLEKHLSARDLAIFETGVRYQLIHALGALAAASFARSGPARAVTAGWLLLAGVVIFSGSLYLLVGLDQRWLGAITPIGGTLFIAGWVVLGLALLRR